MKFKLRNDPTITPELLGANGWNACQDGKAWGLSVIGEGMKLSVLLPQFDRSDWMLWTLRKAGALGNIQYARCAIVCAESVLGIYEEKYPDDKRPREAIEVAIAYAEDPADAAADAADAASDADADAAYAAYAAADAAAYAAYTANNAAYAAAANAAYAAAYAAYAANAAYTAYAAADADAADAARARQRKKMCRLILREIAGGKAK